MAQNTCNGNGDGNGTNISKNQKHLSQVFVPSEIIENKTFFILGNTCWLRQGLYAMDHIPA